MGSRVIKRVAPTKIAIHRPEAIWATLSLDGIAYQTRMSHRSYLSKISRSPSVYGTRLFLDTLVLDVSI